MNRNNSYHSLATMLLGKGGIIGVYRDMAYLNS